MSPDARQANRQVCGPMVIRLGRRGQFTIPAEIRRRMGIEEGEVFSLTQLGDTLVVTRKKPVGPQIAKNVAALMEEEGLTLGGLLEGSERQRETYVREKYGLGA
jgi:AbrB family looped-hinge helix DNA binding protein